MSPREVLLMLLHRPVLSHVLEPRLALLWRLLCLLRFPARCHFGPVVVFTMFRVVCLTLLARHRVILQALVLSIIP